LLRLDVGDVLSDELLFDDLSAHTLQHINEVEGLEAIVAWDFERSDQLAPVNRAL